MTESGVEHPEIVSDGEKPEDELATTEESITEPGKVLRIGSMVKQLLEEVRQAPLDEASRERLAEIYERSVIELSEALSPDLQEELKMIALPFNGDDIPSEAELASLKRNLWVGSRVSSTAFRQRYLRSKSQQNSSLNR